MATVRDIIVEAYSRNNLVPRKREVDADMFTAALKCLNGILQDYSTRGYIVAYKSEVDFDADVNVLVGEGSDAQVYAPKIVSPQNILFQNYTSIDWTPMEYISYDQFYSNNYSDYIVSSNNERADYPKYYRQSLDNLRKEASKSIEDKKGRIQKKGEEIGTKLMFPMMIMLLIVMVFIMVPALFSFQM